MDKITELKSNNNTDRSEEVNDIIERMPTKFGLVVTMLVLLIVILLFVFGWFTKYPDVVTGEITISAKFAPVKQVANFSGKIKLNVKSFEQVKEGSYLAFIKNPANPDDVIYLKTLLSHFDYYHPQKTMRELNFLQVSLGELSESYFKFLSALQQSDNYQTGNVLSEQLKSLVNLYHNQQQNENTINDQILYGKQNLALQKKSFNRDSILYIGKVLTEDEFEKSRMVLLNAEQNFRSLTRDLINIQEALSNTKSQLQQISIQNSDKDKQVKLDYISSYNDLRESIKAWEQKYCFIAPFNGKVQFMKFWKNDEFVSAGDEVFTIVPNNNKPFGQLVMPAVGAGKVKKGQRVIIKIENYPFMEFGSVTGSVSDISLVSKVQQISANVTNGSYLVTVNLPDDLKTNYGSTLDFKFELKGSADIIASDRRLIERLFDNLKYIIKK